MGFRVGGQNWSQAVGRLAKMVGYFVKQYTITYHAGAQQRGQQHLQRLRRLQQWQRLQPRRLVQQQQRQRRRAADSACEKGSKWFLGWGTCETPSSPVQQRQRQRCLQQ